jgi:hypothetical protein
VKEPSETMESMTHICLLCDDKREFPSKENLTAHCKSVHVQSGKKFSSPFPCPECRRCGVPDQSITSVSSWIRHVATAHRPNHLPKSWMSWSRRQIPPKTLTGLNASLKKSTKSHFCLLCGDGHSFYNKGNLTEHCKKVHVETGEFDIPFACPACLQLGEPTHLITTPSSWSSHVEMAHGKDNAPTLRTDPSPCRNTLCPFCGLVRSGRHRSNHVRNGPDSAIFSKPFHCHVCLKSSQHGDSKESLLIDGCSAWNAHVFSAHSERSRTWTVGLQPARVRSI